MMSLNAVSVSACVPRGVPRDVVAWSGCHVLRLHLILSSEPPVQSSLHDLAIIKQTGHQERHHQQRERYGAVGRRTESDGCSDYQGDDEELGEDDQVGDE